jgi:hypothetical protein
MIGTKCRKCEVGAGSEVRTVPAIAGQCGSQNLTANEIGCDLAAGSNRSFCR